MEALKVKAFIKAHSPGGKSVEAASPVCASKSATRLRRVERVPWSACEPKTIRSGAGLMSTLSMIRAANAHHWLLPYKPVIFSALSGSRAP